jgi:hypothetical protein
MPAAEDPRAETRLRALRDFAGRARYPSLTEIVDAGSAEVMTRLDRAGVPFLLLKGPALARFLYRPDERRPYIDVDLLVAPGLRDRAGATLAALGYENLTKRAGVDEFTGALHAETWHSSTRMPVDLHWRLAGCGAPPEKAWPCLFEGRQTVLVAGCAAPVLSRAGLALHLATHAAQHGPRDVKAIGDLERGVDRWPLDDWQAAARLAVAVEGVESLAAGLRLCPQGVALAETLGLPPSAELSWTIVNRGSRPRGTFHLEAFRRAGGPRDAIRVVRRSLLPSRVWIRREYSWAGGSGPRLAAGYARHLLRAPAWAASAWRYRRRARRAARREPG